MKYLFWFNWHDNVKMVTKCLASEKYEFINNLNNYESLKENYV